MSLILSGRYRYLFVVALVMLACFCGFFYFAFGHMQETLTKEKFAGRKVLIDLMCDNLDNYVTLDKNWNTHNYRDTLIRDICQIDKAAGIYAEILDSSLNGITSRAPSFINNLFNIKDYPDILAALQTTESGEATVLWEKNSVLPPHNMYLYWRWIPTDNTLQNRLLIILGVSKYSVDIGFANWVGYGIAILTVVTTGFIVSCIFLLCQLGCIYSSREKEGEEGKWRCNKFSSP